MLTFGARVAVSAAVVRWVADSPSRLNVSAPRRDRGRYLEPGPLGVDGTRYVDLGVVSPRMRWHKVEEDPIAAWPGEPVDESQVCPLPPVRGDARWRRVPFRACAEEGRPDAVQGIVVGWRTVIDGNVERHHGWDDPGSFRPAQRWRLVEVAVSVEEGQRSRLVLAHPDDVRPALQAAIERLTEAFLVAYGDAVAHGTTARDAASAARLEG